MGIILEPRLLFDASVGPATDTKQNNTDNSTTTASSSDGSHATTDKSTTPPPAADQNAGEQAKAATTPATDAQKTPTSADPSASKDTSSTNQSGAAGASGASASNTAIDSVLFVDPRVSGWQDLAGSVSASTKVVVIDPTLDGISQVTQTLSELHGIKEVDFLTYGHSGQIELGSSVVNDASLMANATAVAGWRNSLTDNAQIQFWGCDVGAGDAGAAFVNDMHTLTGVGIAASTDATGAAVMNGDWVLERTAGDVTAFHPFSADAEAHYATVLDAPTATVTLDLPDSVLLGNTYTATLTFTNSGNATGYGPFVELFVQTNTGTGATEASTLTSATFLGAPVTVTAVTIVDLDPAHPGTVLGATNPLLLDASGSPTVITPPAGFKAGDTMYVLSLPFGSFTVGQPTATITLNFQNDSHSNLSSAHGLTMTAIGGYQFGADALNNPGTDPSILDTTHQATDSSNVNLINVTTSVNTWPGDGETATGKAFPGTYVFNLTPASAVSGDPISNVDFTFDVPADVQYNGDPISITTSAGDTGTVTFTPSSTTPGGTLTVHFTQISGAASISMPFFVPLKNSGNTDVISTATDAPKTISLTPAYHYTQIGGSQWTPGAGSFTATPITVADAGAGTTLSFDAKSFAVQISDSVTTDTGISGFSPGDTLTYTLHFQVSDYFNLDNLVLTNTLGDGLTLDPNVSPVLTLVRDGVSRTFTFDSIADLLNTVRNGQNVADQGSNAYWSYDTRDGSGKTTMTFDVGALLDAKDSSHGGSLLTGTDNGTYGTITFVAKVLDKYTDANGGNSIREKDSTTDTVSGQASVAGNLTGTAHTITDGDSVTNAEAAGEMLLSITDINGSPAPGTVKVQAGDLVTYQLEYDLSTGDYGNLNLTAYLPLPVYGVPGSLTAGDGLTVNTYKVISQPAGSAAPSVTSDSAANSIAFNFGDYDSTSNAASQKVIVQFTLQASDKPFADGLALTTQGQTKYTNAGGDLLATAAIKQQTMQEPSLTMKTGVVSVVNDGTTAKGTYAHDTGSSDANPTTIFDPAKSGGVFVSGIPTTIGDAENQNVSGVDGKDTVRIVETVQNTGHGDAYKVTVGGTLPSGYSDADVTNLKVTRGDGIVLTFTGTTADFFNGTGIVINGADGSTATPALTGVDATTHKDILFVTYDLKIADAQTVATTLTATGKIINFFAAPAAATGFVSGGTVVGGSAASLTDTATITTSSPSFTKTLTAGDDSTHVSLPGVVVGETITYTFTLTIPEGGMSNVAFDDTLPAFLGNVTGGTVTFGTNIGHTGDSALTVVGNHVTANFGTVTNTNADATGTITFTVTAKVLDSTNTNGTAIQNDAKITSTGIPDLTSSVTATEKDPSVTQTLTDNAGNTAVHSGQVVTYTIVLQNDGTAPAEDLVDTLSIPTGLTYGADLAQTGGSNSGVTVDAATGKITVDRLLLGAANKLTFTFTATVNDDRPAGTQLKVTASSPYTSMPNTVAGERSYTLSTDDTVTTGVFVPVISIVGESQSTDTSSPPTNTSPQSTADAVVGEIVRMRAYVEVPTGQSTLSLDINLPAGFEFVDNTNATVALGSANGSLKSSTIDATGSDSGIQFDSTGYNIATAPGPTAAFDSSHLTFTATKATFDFGTVQNNTFESGTKNYAIVEFNVIVKNTSANQNATALAVTAAVGSTTSTAATVTVVEPVVTITKVVDAINQATGEVTWKVVVSNTGTAKAYDVNLSDVLSTTNQGTISSASASGDLGALDVSANIGQTTFAATMNLGIGQSETFTYKTTVTGAVPDGTATVTYTSLDSTQTTAFHGTTDNAAGGGHGAAGTVDGERTGADGVGGALNDYTATASAGIRTASGNVWNDIGSPLNAQDANLDSTADSYLSGITITGSWNNGSGAINGTVNTDTNGFYKLFLPDNVAATVTAPRTSGSETLVYDTDGSFGTVIHHTEGGLSVGNATLTLAAGTSNAYTGLNFAYRLPDTAPTISTWGASDAAHAVTYTMGTANGVVLSTGSTDVTDAQLDLAAINNYNGTVLTIQRHGAADSADLFGGNGNATTGLFFSGSNVLYNGVTIGTFTQSGGSLAITFANATTSADVKNVLNNVTYKNTGPTSQLVSGILIDATLKDHNTQTGTSPATGNNAYQGTGGEKVSAAVSILVNVAPAAVAATFTETNDSVPTGTNTTAEQGAAVALSSGFSLSNLGPTTTLNGNVVLTVSSGYQNGQDVLSFTNGSGMGNIAGVWDATAGTMTLSSAGNAATQAQWQAALQAVKFYNTSDTPNTVATRVVSIAASADDSEAISGTFANVTVNSANDSPVLDTGVTITLPHSTEDVSAAPADGTTPAASFAVSTLLGLGTGPNNVTDQDGPAADEGIAITKLDTTHGTWYYSVNGGTTWNTLTVASGHARLLDSTALLYFAPNTPADWNGTISNAIGYRAWDQFSGTTNSDITLPGTVGTGTTDPLASSISFQEKFLNLVVDPVNDAPVASGSATLLATNEDTASPPGATVSSLFGSNFNDSKDTVSGGSSANTLAGVAITADTANATTQGSWQYWNGTSWTSITSGSPTDTNAIVLSKDAMIRFLPVTNFNGTPPGLTVRLIDSSTQAVAGTTGAALSAGGAAAITGVDVSTNGGTTAISAATVALGTSVTAVNDSPIVSGSADLPHPNEDTPSSTGTTVGTLIAQGTVNYDDAAADTITGGSTGTGRTGIAITANAADPAQGKWQYFSGGVWNDIPTTGLSNTNALVLSDSTAIRFNPTANWNGTPGVLTAHVSDGTTGVTNGLTDVSANIGTTSEWSSGTISIGTVVPAINDAPIASTTTVNLTSTPEDTTSPTGATVSSLFGTSFSDTADEVPDGNGSHANTLAGVAIVGDTANASTQGSWQYWNGTTWTSITAGGPSDTNAIVLSKDAMIRFVPVANWNGTPGGLTVRLIDSSTESVAGTTGSALSAGGAAAITGVNVSTNGGTTAISAAITPLATVVTAVNDAPTASDATLTLPEDTVQSTTSGDTVGSLFTGHFSDTTDQVTGGSSANTLAGIAITGNAETDPTHGTWRYSTDGGTTWSDIPTTGLSDSSALALNTSARIEFVPAANWNGTPGALTVRVIDNSSGAITNPALPTDRVDVSTNGGITPISGTAVQLKSSVTAVNDSPVVSGSATLTNTNEDSAPTTGADTVASLIGQGTVNYSDATDDVTGGSSGTARTGIAITGNAATAAQGAWQYSTDGGTTWAAIPTTGLSNTNAFVLASTDKVRFVPAADWNGTPGALTAHISDGTGGLPADGLRDISANIGTTGQWSSGTITINEFVPPVNDAPVASGTATLTSVPEDSTQSTLTGSTVQNLFIGNFTDATDEVTPGTTGSSNANDFGGIAITGNAATGTQGAWKYSLDGGTTWLNVPTTVSDTAALFLPTTAKIEFVPTGNWNGTPGGLTVRLYDTSTTLPTSGGTVDVSTHGGTTAISNSTVPLGTVVTPVNDAPVPTGTSVTLVTQGDSVTNLFTSHFSDTTDTVTGGSSANTFTGIAITGNAANATTQGVWQYSVDGGATYHDVPTTLAETSGLILPDSAKIQFVGVPGYTGTPGGLTVHVIDSSTDVSIPGVGTGSSLHNGTTAYTNVDVSTNSGGTTAISAATLPFNTIVAGSVAGSFVEPNDSATGTAAEIAAQVPVNDTVVLNQAPTNVYTSATFQITGAYQNGEDVLAFTNDGSTMGDIVGSFNAATGTMTLTSSTATGAQWQAALRAVQYYDASDSPHTTDRTVAMNIVNNGTGQSLGNATVSVTAVNDSPVLDTSVAESLPHGTEDALGAPSAGSGFLVSSILVGNVTDPDGNNAHDAVAGGTDGIAVVGADTTQGSWWYSIDGGTTWTKFASSSMTAISGSNALHLQADAKLYFQPTNANWNGTLPTALSYRAWDRYDSAANGSLSALPSGLGTGQNTTGSAYSSAVKVLPLTVDPVNDAPIATGTASLAPVTAGNPPASATVTELFSSTFNDQTDQVTGGSSANTLAGIAITGNSATAGQGTWKYSLDNGTTWVEIVPSDVSLTTALILPNTAKIEFVAAGGFTGSPGALAVHLIDSSNGAVTFSASTDVSTNGGITAISADPVPLRTTINAVPNNPNPPIPPSDYLTAMSAYGNLQGGYSVFTGGIANEWLMGENVFRVMEVGIPGVANVSADVFYGSVPKQNLTFEAVNLSGGALPPWLFFDVATLRFSGTPPEGSEGTIDARVIARDFKGHEAVADVHIVILREQKEILGLLRTSSSDRPPITVPPAPTPGDQPPGTGNGQPIILDSAPTTNAPSGNAPPAGDGAGPQGSAPPSGDGAPANRAPPGVDGQRQGSFGLSPQLREFSQAGRLARARGLLNALSAGPTAL